MSKERIVYLDVVRIFACVMIIMMHAPIPNTGISSSVLVTDSVSTAPGVGLFVMVSGALLLPVKLPTVVFLKKRLSKLAFPVLFWTFFYMGVKLYGGSISIPDIPKSIISIPFSAQFNGVLWFVYMLIGLYLLAPIFSPWLEKVSRRELELYLAIWAVTLCYPLVEKIIIVDERPEGVLYYFSGYVGYFLLGYYLRRYTPRIPLLICVFLIFLPLSVGAYCKFYDVKVSFYDVFWYLSVLTVGAAIGWFSIIQRQIPLRQKPRLSCCVSLISNCCFGVYLSHIFLMRTILWRWEMLQNTGGVIQIVITTVLTFVGCLIITWLISKLPFGGYIVGYNSKG